VQIPYFASTHPSGNEWYVYSGENQIDICIGTSGKESTHRLSPPKKENLVYTVASVPALNSSFNSYIRAQAQPVAKSATLMKAHSTFFPRGASPVGLGDAALELDAVVGVLDALPDPFAEAELSELSSSSSLLFGMTTPPWMVAGLVETFTLFGRREAQVQMRSFRSAPGSADNRRADCVASGHSTAQPLAPKACSLTLCLGQLGYG
jgi:hypothetical protein